MKSTIFRGSLRLATGFCICVSAWQAPSCQAAGWEPPNATDLRAAYCKTVIDDHMQPMQLAIMQAGSPKMVRTIVRVKRSIDSYLTARPDLDSSGLRVAASQARADLDALHSECSKETATCAEGAKTKDAMEACFVRGQECVKSNPKLLAAQNRMAGCLGENWMLVP